MPRRPGRPKTDTLQPDLLLSEAAALIAEGGLKKFSMRGLARRLSVDPMALYHYFPSRDALLAATAGHVFDQLSVSFTEQQRWDARLDALAAAYLALCREHQGLLTALIQGDIDPAGPVQRFDALLSEALRGISLTAAQRGAVGDAVIDLLNGVALSADHSARWRDGFSVLVAGIAAISREAAP